MSILWSVMVCCCDLILFIVNMVLVFIVFIVVVIWFSFCLVDCSLVVLFELFLFFFDFFLLIFVVWVFVDLCKWLYFCFRCWVLIKGEFVIIVFRGFDIWVVRVWCMLLCLVFILFFVELYCNVVWERVLVILFGVLDLYFW